MKEFDVKLMGKRIKELREGLELTQRELADKIGVASNTVTQYEKGLITTKVDILFKLVIALETTSDYLLGLIEYYDNNRR